MNCAVSPSAYKNCVPEPGMIVMADSARGAGGDPGLTVSVAVPVIVEPSCAIPLAVMVAVQLLEAQPTAVACPEELTEATSVSLDCHVTIPARFSVVGLLSNVPIAVN